MIAQELWNYMKARKKFWLLPIIITLALLATMVLATQGTVIAPFIYTIF